MTINTLSSLDAISPLDGRYHAITQSLAPYFSEGALIHARVEVEVKYLIALSEHGIVRPLTAAEKEQLSALPQLTAHQLERMKEIETITRHDVKAMERGIRELVQGTFLEDVTEMIHFGLTSEDINNLSFRLLFDRARKEVFVPAFEKVVDRLAEQATIHKDLPMLARTHGQDAIPTTVGKELAYFAIRLQRQIKSLLDVQLEGKLAGAVGNFNALVTAQPNVDWIAFSEKFVTSLGLRVNLFVTQIATPEDVIALLQAYTRINGILLDLNQDMWRYVSDGWMTQEVKKGEVGSSTMPQKVNPIDFENSEGNIKVATGMIDSTIHALATSRLQRDLSGSTVIRNVGAALAYSLLAAQSTLTGLQRISPNTAVITKRLNNNWAILTEAVQTILRKNNIPDAYSLIARLSHGQEISEKEWQEWIEKLPVDASIKDSLSKITPQNYLGKAAKLTEMALAEIGTLRQ